MSLINEALLARDMDFRLRVEAAMARAAQDVMHEADTTANHTARLAMAHRFFGVEGDARESVLTAMVRRVCTNATVMATATQGEAVDEAAVPDSDIQFVVNSEWDTVAAAAWE